MAPNLVPAEHVPAADLAAFLRAAWSGEMVAAHGERIFPLRLPGFAAVDEGRVVGHVSYRVAGGACEVTSIVADPPRRGIGSRLMDSAIEEARRAGCHAIWLTTTNDNLDALRFYQRRGFRLSALRIGAVDEARRALKLEIPTIGSYGIPMRDELDLALDL